MSLMQCMITRRASVTAITATSIRAAYEKKNVHCSSQSASDVNADTHAINTSAGTNTNVHQNLSSRVTKSEREYKKQCKECMYTGVATCTGLSLYFVKLASEIPEASVKTAVKQVHHKNFLLGGGAIWAVAGAYRFYLG
mmetsp:Transcript_9771/g.14657  ORF Transcript_9771/g.14657 Transcript_9771/m.14657 type:complete len:139 (-) Transcript_9771:70-486(-)